MSNIKHIEIEAWLTALALQEYTEFFRGYNGVEEILYMSERDILGLGVRNGAHRARMISSLVMLREKLNKKVGKFMPGISPPSCSPNPSPPSLVNNPEYSAMPLHQHTYQQPIYVLNQGPKASEKRDIGDVTNYLWYHGNIPRQKAEKLVMKDGDFLLRDSISQPGDYVLTVSHINMPIHFVINKQCRHDKNGGVHIQYQFEEDLFDSVPELVHFYVSNRKAISEGSGARICTPVVRNLPVDYYDIGHHGRGPSPILSRRPLAVNTNCSPRGSPKPSPLTTPCHSPPMNRRPPRRTGSQPLLSMDDDMEEHEELAMKDKMKRSRSLERQGGIPSMTIWQGQQVTRCTCIRDQCTRQQAWCGSDPSLSPVKKKTSPKAKKKVSNFFGTLKAALSKSQDDLDREIPPPKPSRTPTFVAKGTEKPVVEIRNKELYEDDGRDYSDYDQVKSWAPEEKNGNGKVSGSQSFSVNAKRHNLGKSGSSSQDSILEMLHKNQNKPQCENDYDVPKTPKEKEMDMDGNPIDKNMETNGLNNKLPDHKIMLPNMNAPSNFSLGRYESQILPPENKPLDNSSITTVKSLLMESNPQLIAQHITLIDLMILKVMNGYDLGVEVASGLELLTLPQGHQMREDALERYQCFKLFVAVTILTCSKYPERAQMLHKWIQIAHELKHVLGNLYSFSSVMEGITLPPILKLKNTWIALKQNHPNSSFLFEAKLSNQFRSLAEASSMLPLQNITIPYVTPLLQLLERDDSDTNSVLPWEQGQDFGLDILLAHLDTARIITEQCGLYRVTAENIMKGFHPIKDMVDVFRTELHMKLLWGARGAGVNRLDRYTKFDQLLYVLSERVEPNQNTSPETSV